MDESAISKQQSGIKLEFKPDEPNSGLRPAETRLLLAYIGEILQEIEIEERKIIEEERLAAQEITVRKTPKGDTPCK